MTHIHDWQVIEHGQLREGSYRIERCSVCGEERGEMHATIVLPRKLAHVHDAPERKQ